MRAVRTCRSFHTAALMPHIHDWEGAKLYGHALAFNTPLKVCEFGKQSGMFETEKSFVELVEEGLVLSSVTKTENDAEFYRAITTFSVCQNN